jgi:hypothetical protein
VFRSQKKNKKFRKKDRSEALVPKVQACLAIFLNPGLIRRPYAGSSNSHSSIVGHGNIVVTRADFQKLADMRIKEAGILLAAGEFDGAYYLAGYAVECALKGLHYQEKAVCPGFMAR